MGVIIIIKVLIIIANEENFSNIKRNKLDSVVVTEEKTIIYLYPKETMQISTKLGRDENLTCTYPKYEGEWNVIVSEEIALRAKFFIQFSLNIL